MENLQNTNNNQEIYNNNNNNIDNININPNYNKNKNKINEEKKEDKDKKKLSIEDFEISFTLGKGSYAKVVLAKNKKSQKLYALKIIDKKFLKRVNKK
jgi:hypothetical protein